MVMLVYIGRSIEFCLDRGVEIYRPGFNKELGGGDDDDRLWMVDAIDGSRLWMKSLLRRQLQF